MLSTNVIHMKQQLDDEGRYYDEYSLQGGVRDIQYYDMKTEFITCLIERLENGLDDDIFDKKKSVSCRRR